LANISLGYRELFIDDYAVAAMPKLEKEEKPEEEITPS